MLGGFVSVLKVQSCLICTKNIQSCYWKKRVDLCTELPWNFQVASALASTCSVQVSSKPNLTSYPNLEKDCTKSQYPSFIEDVLFQWLENNPGDEDLSHWHQLRNQLAQLPGAKQSILNLCQARILACSKYSLYRIKRGLQIAQILYQLQADFLTIVTGILVSIPSNYPVQDLSIGGGYRILVESVSRSLSYIWSCLSRCDTEPAKVVQGLYQQAKDNRGILISLVVFLVDLRYQCNRPFSIVGIDDSLAKVCLYILAPAAGYLGIWKLQLELEEVAFRVLHPTEYESLSRHVGRILQQRSKILEYARFHICRLLNTSCNIQNQIISFSVHGRVKGLYSIYKKMKRGRKLKEIFDLIALRIIIKPRNPLNEVQACYVTLTTVEERWSPMACRSKDFIKYPKPNGYRALHTTVILNKIPFEVQIRSEEMHQHAEYGNAAHFLYKLSQSNDCAVNGYSREKNIPVNSFEVKTRDLHE